MTPPGPDRHRGRDRDRSRDRDASSRARNARPRDRLGRPLPRGQGGPAPEDPPALPPAQALARAQALLRQGRPFEAHEVLEAVWKATPDPASRDLWRGLAQLAVGITHALRGNDSGAQALFRRAAGTLAAYAGAAPYDVDIDGLREWADAASRDPRSAESPPRLRRT